MPAAKRLPLVLDRGAADQGRGEGGTARTIVRAGCRPSPSRFANPTREREREYTGLSTRFLDAVGRFDAFGEATRELALDGSLGGSSRPFYDEQRGSNGSAAPSPPQRNGSGSGSGGTIQPYGQRGDGSTSPLR